MAPVNSSTEHKVDDQPQTSDASKVVKTDHALYILNIAWFLSSAIFLFIKTCTVIGYSPSQVRNNMASLLGLWNWVSLFKHAKNTVVSRCSCLFSISVFEVVLFLYRGKAVILREKLLHPCLSFEVWFHNLVVNDVIKTKYYLNSSGVQHLILFLFFSILLQPGIFSNDN